MSASALILLIALLPFATSGCSGGGGGGGPSQITITITACDTTTYASEGVVCVDFLAKGPAGVFDLLAQFIGGTSGPLQGAYEIPAGLAAQLGITSNSQNYVLNFNGDTVSGRYCWFAGADLGFVPSQGVQFFLTPVDDGTQSAAGPVVTCSFNYNGGGSTQPLTPSFNPSGRAGHCAANVGAKNVVIAGGFNASVIPFNSVNRFSFDTMNFTYSSGPSLPMTDARAEQACSFFLDPVTQAIKLLVTGGVNNLAIPVASASADVYCFSPVETVSPTFGSMNVARQGHSATWVPANKVLIIGGVNGVNALGSIEIYDPVLDTFQLLASSLSFPRQNHSATLLPSGKILVAGGFNPASPVALPAEIVDPATGISMTVAGPTVDRVRHTATRLANGWVLLAGGAPVAGGPATSSAQIFQPELGGMGQFTATMPMMNTARAHHGASLLGTGDALLTGGDTGVLGMATTQSSELFLYQTLTFTSIIPMSVPRAEHSSTATSCGAIVLIGGRNDLGGTTNFLGSIEIYPFENTNPDIASAFTGASPSAGTVYILATVTDADADGGYVIIRFRTGGGAFRLATIDQQQPTTGGGTFPNMQVFGMPNQALPYSFRWNFTADGLSSGQTAEVEVLPIGATLGTPVRFNVTLP